ncbi:hypothetical protein CRYUN_Cryun16bG0134100 [Craigia yunnanensis]
MARFRSHSLPLLRQIFSPLLLLLIFIITIHPSYGYQAVEPMPPLQFDMDFLTLVCQQTSDSNFCVEKLSNSEASAPWATAVDIANCALRSAQGRADEARSLIVSMLQDSATKINQLERCQVLNNRVIDYFSSANNNLYSGSFDAMVEDLNKAASATKSCQDMIIPGISSFWELANMNSDIIKFCEICVVAREFFTSVDHD